MKFTIMLCYCILILFLGVQTSFAANHSSGLHIQFTDKVVDIKNTDIEQHQVFQVGPNSTSIMIRLKSDAAKRLYTLTESRIGQPIVWIWDGRVLSMEKLTAPIDHDFSIHNLTPFEAEDFDKKEFNSSSR